MKPTDFTDNKTVQYKDTRGVDILMYIGQEITMLTGRKMNSPFLNYKAYIIIATQ